MRNKTKSTTTDRMLESLGPEALLEFGLRHPNAAVALVRCNRGLLGLLGERTAGYRRRMRTCLRQWLKRAVTSAIFARKYRMENGWATICVVQSDRIVNRAMQGDQVPPHWRLRIVSCTVTRPTNCADRLVALFLFGKGRVTRAEGLPRRPDGLDVLFHGDCGPTHDEVCASPYSFYVLDSNWRRPAAASSGDWCISLKWLFSDAPMVPILL
ncbi:Hypothetical protein UVM_LOCUS158 [uncultured virus]|nr:Hypothetical protein UVM_LOCUS158 [uncultured virus]